MNDDGEPFCITNPMRKQYKFLFRVALDDDTLKIAMRFIVEWLEQHGWTIKRQKVICMPLQEMFQVKVWLN